MTKTKKTQNTSNTKKETHVLRKAGYENVSEQINKIIDNIISK